MRRDRQMVPTGVSPPGLRVGDSASNRPVVEVFPVLDPQEKAVFDGIMTQLRDDDPSFVRRVDRISKPRRRVRLTAAILLWTLTPWCIVYGGWTGLILAVLALGYGTLLFSRRHQSASPPLWTSSRGRRPGTAPSV
jgi:hypothetical protein